eukprot:scaffold303858_cov35-Tisochrysis_lutea.AAC.2
MQGIGPESSQRIQYHDRKEGPQNSQCGEMTGASWYRDDRPHQQAKTTSSSTVAMTWLGAAEKCPYLGTACMQGAVDS